MGKFLPYVPAKNPTTQPLLGAGQTVILTGNQNTVITAASDGVDVGTFDGTGVLNVASTANFVNGDYNNELEVSTSVGTATITFTGGTATTFTGCTLVSGSGTLATGGAVTNPNTATALITGTASWLGITAFSDQAGTITVQQSFDGVNWDGVSTISVAADTVGEATQMDVVGTFIQIMYTNTGGAAQTEFRFYAKLYTVGRENG